MSLLAIAQLTEGKKLRPVDILDLFEYCQEQKHGERFYMLKDCTVKWPDGVINSAFETLKSERRGKQIGSLSKGTVSWWNQPRQVSAAIGVYRTRYNNEHYVLLDHNLEEKYDPNPEVKRSSRKFTIFYNVGPDLTLL